MTPKTDPRKIASMHDIGIAKERYRYEALVREQALLSITGSVKRTVRATLNTGLQYFAQFLIAAAARRLFRRKSRKE